MRTFVFTAAAALLLSAPGARASLIGDTVSAAYLVPDTSTVVQNLGTATVGPGVEFAFQRLNLDFGATTLIISEPVPVSFGFGAASFNGFRFADLTSPFTSASVDAASNVPGFNAADLSLSAGMLFVNLQDLSFLGTEVVIDIPATPSVPEPSTLAIFATALLALGALCSRLIPKGTGPVVRLVAHRLTF